jgi:hypothetical protein
MFLCGGVEGQAEDIINELEDITGIAPKLVEELWINKLKRVTNKSGYRVQPDFTKFKKEIDDFIKSINNTLNLE